MILFGGLNRGNLKNESRHSQLKHFNFIHDNFYYSTTGKNVEKAWMADLLRLEKIN